MPLQAIQGGGAAVLPPVPEPPMIAPAPPPPILAPAPPSPSPVAAMTPPAPAPISPGLQSEGGGIVGNIPAPGPTEGVSVSAAPPPIEPPASTVPGEVGGSGGVTFAPNVPTSDEQARSLASASEQAKAKHPAGVGAMWTELMVAWYTQPHAQHQNVQGLNDGTLDLLKTVPIIPVKVPPHPVAL